MTQFYLSEWKQFIDLPVNCVYLDTDTYTDKLSTYGKGYVDGMLTAWRHEAKHRTVFAQPGDSDTRRAYVIGYHDGYDNYQAEQSRRLARTGD